MNIAIAVQNGIIEALKSCAITGEFIDTHQYARGIGKTTTLIKFAKQYGMTVVVHTADTARYLSDRFQYGEIYGQNEIRGRVLGNVVFDEGVDLIKLDGAKCRVVTGYICK